MKLTVYYDGQFWVGVFEETDHGKLRAYRYVFGPEPRDNDVLDLINRQMLRLVGGVSRAIQTEEEVLKKINPKRMARIAAAEMNQPGISTKAQQALKLEQEQRKKDQAALSKQKKEVSDERKWLLRKVKAKEKHRGR
jgi:hypothetical protein